MNRYLVAHMANGGNMSHIVVLVLQVVVALGLLNVWLVRAGKPTSYRGGNAGTMREEFAHYGLPGWAMYVVGTLKVAADDFTGPNGLCFSPDERMLYVAESGGQFDEEPTRHIRRFDVAEGKLHNGRVFHKISPGFADGLRPGLTQAARDGADEGGRDGETPLDRTEKHRHDGRDGNPGLYF